MKKVLCIFFSLLFVFPMILFTSAAEYGETTIKRDYDMSKSKSISEDFKIGFGNSYTVSAFPFDENFGDFNDVHDDVSLITFTSPYSIILPG